MLTRRTFLALAVVTLAGCGAPGAATPAAPTAAPTAVKPVFIDFYAPW
jgi:hypothetical protein